MHIRLTPTESKVFNLYLLNTKLNKSLSLVSKYPVVEKINHIGRHLLLLGNHVALKLTLQISVD